MYQIKNQYGRNQIQDRIAMLADFYDATFAVKFQYPTMILSGTKEIFKKRIRRLKKMSAADCSSQQTSQQSAGQSLISFQSSGFLHTIKTQQFAQKSNSMNRSSMSFQSQLQKSVYDIYYHEENLHQTFFRPNQTKTQFLPQEQQQQLLSHLVCDMQEFDKQKTIQLYNKIKESNNMIEDNAKKSMKKSTITITPIDFNPEQKNKENQNRQLKLQRIFKKQQQNKNRKSSSVKKSKVQASIYDDFEKKQYENKYRREQTQRHKYHNYHLHRQRFQTRRNLYDTNQRSYDTNQRSQQNSQHRSVNKQRKRQILQRAAALLQRVKSEQQFHKQAYFPRRYYQRDYY